MTTSLDHSRTPRTPLSARSLHDLAVFLLDGRPGRIDYADMAQLIEHGDYHRADPRGVAAARARLTAAAERGNVAAAAHLMQLATREETAG